MSIAGNTTEVDEGKSSCSEKLMTPRFVLGLWTLMNFFTYYDRGAIASSLAFVRKDPVIAGDGTISDAEGGAIVSAFMVGFFVTCPIFAALGGTFTAKRIITGGLVVWALACFSTAISQSYWMILISRMFVGVGEAAYAGYTVTIIDNMAPTKSRTAWIGIYYSMIAVGTASGMTGGGIISKLVNLSPSIPGWRVVFATEIIPMFPIIVLNALLPAKYNPVKGGGGGGGKLRIVGGGGGEEEETLAAPLNKRSEEAGNAATTTTEEGAGDDFVTLPMAMKQLATNLNYVLLVIGYAMYTFVLGAVAVWAISMLEEGPLHLGTIDASLFMGAATAVTGLLGSICGGVFVDKMGAGKGIAGVVACSKYLVIVMCLSIPCGVMAFLSSSLPLFATFFVLGVFLLFSVTAPVNAAILSSVPLPLRTYAISFSVFFMHMLGDFPSPIIAGVIADKFSGGCDALGTTDMDICVAHKDCRWVPAKAGEDPACVNMYQLRNALLIVWCVMIVAVPCWAVVGIRAWRHLKRDKEDEMRASLNLTDNIEGGDGEDEDVGRVSVAGTDVSMATRSGEAQDIDEDDDGSGLIAPGGKAQGSRA